MPGSALSGAYNGSIAGGAMNGREVISLNILKATIRYFSIFPFDVNMIYFSALLVEKYSCAFAVSSSKESQDSLSSTCRAAM
jgi:hypothetical protein